MKASTARFQLTLSMVIFGTIGLVVRSIPLPSSVVALGRGVIGSLFLLAVMALRRTRFRWADIRRNLVWLLPSGAALGFNWILLFEAYRYTSVAVATMCYYMAPILIILASPFALGERLTGKKLLCVAAALAGMAGVSGVLRSGLPAAGEGRGILLGLAAAVLYACVILLNKQIKGVPAFDRTILQLIISAAVLTPYCLVTVPGAALQVSASGWLMLGLAGILHTGLAYYCYFGSLESLSGQTAAILSYVDPVVAVLTSVLLLREPIHPTEALGALLILGAAFVSERE